METMIEFCTWGLLIISTVLIGGMLLFIAGWLIGGSVYCAYLVAVTVREEIRDARASEARDE